MKCQFPYLVENPQPSGFSHIPVPCGKCYDCKMRLCSQWAFRLLQEEKISTSSHFVTLTYDPEHVPITPKGYMTLDKKKHLQNFFKTLRNQYRYRAIDSVTGRMKYFYDRVPKIKYFAVGEYGSIGDRPHYHAIILNADESAILNSWRFGHVHVGAVASASIMYCLKYVMKEGKIPKHKNDDRIPEYRRSSLRLGVAYLSKAIIKYHRENPLKQYITMEGGYKVAIPRYFKEKIWTEEELKKINSYIADELEKMLNREEQKHNRKSDENYIYHEQKKAQYRTERSARRERQTRSNLQ